MRGERVLWDFPVYGTSRTPRNFVEGPASCGQPGRAWTLDCPGQTWAMFQWETHPRSSVLTLLEGSKPFGNQRVIRIPPATDGPALLAFKHYGTDKFKILILLTTMRPRDFNFVSSETAGTVNTYGVRAGPRTSISFRLT
jgi:hypothetical protein